MQHLFDEGKALYERSDKTRLKDYTYKQLLKLVRREQLADGAGANAAYLNSSCTKKAA